MSVLPDPVVTNSRKFIYVSHADKPLYAAGGPKPEDCRQEPSLTDGWLVAGLAAVAASSPKAVTDAIVDHKDGTYSVWLKEHKNSKKEYLVDADLPGYAKPGRDGCVWAPIVEKAFAHHRSGLYKLKTAAYGVLYRGLSYQVFSYLGAKRISFDVSANDDVNVEYEQLVTRLKAGMVAATFVVIKAKGTPLTEKRAYRVVGADNGKVTLHDIVTGKHVTVTKKEFFTCTLYTSYGLFA